MTEKSSAKRFLNDAAAFARQNVSVIVLAIVAVIFIAILREVAEGEIMRLDTLAYQFFVVRLRSEWLTPIMEGFSSLASPAVILVMAIVVAAFAPGSKPGRCVVLNLACVLVLNQALKFIVQRPRPDGFRLVSEIGYSFPSGHSMLSMAFYGLLIWFIWRYETNRAMRRVWCATFAVIIVMVGVSRIYLGVHYASDVIAGFCVSFAWLMFFTRIVAPALMEETPPEKKQ